MKNFEGKVEKKNTVKPYDASTSPVFLVVIVATPNWVRASNVGTLTLKIFPGLLEKRKPCQTKFVKFDYKDNSDGH